ncbi:hypothetical protein [Planctomicrobium piriforme]|uniref:Uncharacterized protein n=1 Tax=Planctomicrobium piriforme TaxID=1576369 RepID=A0A1I3G0M7_9PLAN|nr:hypothetical protein [Planctomicrobium piriforme]SFI17035.1 hypothetical protein SAMN05421753_106120 [Planctomicrobium piriforme]
MRLFGLSAVTAIAPVTDRFVSLSVGNTLILKACGFIEDHQARILDVDESSLKVRIGFPWHRRWLHGLHRKPIDVSLQIRRGEMLPESASQKLSPDRYCMIDVVIQPVALGWQTADFHQEARRLVWSLRSYFMAC